MRSFSRSKRALLAVLAGFVGLCSANVPSALAADTLYSIGGKALTPEGAAIPGVTIKIDGSAKTTLTSSTGEYNLAELPAGTYTVLAKKEGFSFDPASKAVTVPAAEGEFAPNGRARFVGKPIPAPTYYVAGLIKLTNGEAIPGVEVKLISTADTSKQISVLTNSEGRYRVEGLLKGSYVVVPKKENFKFSPENATVTLPTTGLEYSPNARANFYGAKLVTELKVFGKVTLANGTPLPNVRIYNTATVTDGTVPVAVTNSDGKWAVEHLKAGTYSFTPKLAGYTFDPATGSVTIPSTGLEWSPNGRIVFVAAPVVQTRFAIKGKVVNAKGNPMTGVTVKVGNLDKSALTDANGEYRIGDLPAGEYAVEPSKTNFVFTPEKRTVTLPTSGEPQSPAAQANFAGKEKPLTYKVFGKVTNKSGAALAGVTVKLGADGPSMVTGTSGEYAFENVAEGTYIVTPSKSNFTFSPAYAPVTVPTTGLTESPNGKATFVGSEASTTTYKIYGTVKTSEALAPLAGVAVTLNDGTTVKATTTDGGAFVISGLPAGTYTLHFKLEGYSFEPSTPTVTFPLSNGSTVVTFAVVAAPVK